MINDLRDFIAACRDINEVRDIDGADWEEEIGALTEAAAELIEDPPALLFDSVKGYPRGYRVFALPMATHRRVAAALGLPTDRSKLETMRLAADRMTQALTKLTPPVEVASAPVMQNVLRGDEIDLLRFPVPRYHSSDGGR